MATINSKKLLPGSEKKEVFLVPTTSIVPSAPKLDGVKPSEKKASKSSPEIEGKIIQVTELFNNNLLLKAADRERKRKEEERKEFEEREKKLEEKKLGKKGQQESLVSKIPGSSIFDRLKTFLGFTLFGFIFNNYSKYLPRLTALGKVIKPAVDGFLNFSETILSSTITFIDEGYKAYDTVGKWVEDIGGDNAKTLFDKFSGELNTFLNTAILIGLAGIRGGSITPRRGGPGGQKKPDPQGPPGPQRPGGVGASFAAGFATGFAICEAKGKLNSKQISDVAKEARKKYMQSISRGLSDTVAQKRVIKESIQLSRQKALERSRQIARPVKQLVGTSAGRSSPGIAAPAPGVGGREDAVRKMFQETIGDVDDFDRLVKGLTSRGVPLDEARLQAKELLERSKINTVKSSYWDELFERVGAKQLPKQQVIDQLFGAVSEGKLSLQALKDIAAKQAREGILDAGDLKFINSLSKEALQDFRQSSGTTDLYKALQQRAGDTVVPPKPSAPKLLSPKLPSGGIAASIKRAVLSAPVIGSVVDFILNLLFGEKPSRAAARAIGSGLGAWGGNALGLAITGGIGFFSGGIGLALAPVIVGGLSLGGGLLGDFIFGAIYDALGGAKLGFSQGGVVPGRRIKETKKIGTESQRNIPEPFSVSLRKDKNFESYYKDSYNLIGDAHQKLSQVGGFIGSLMTGTIALLYGQAFDRNLLNYIGLKYGRQTQNKVESVGNDIVQMIRREVYSKKNITLRQSKSPFSQARDFFNRLNYKAFGGGYPPPTPGYYNVAQYITGDSTQGNNYDPKGHGGDVYHEHFAFKTVADKERAKAALIAAGFEIGSEYRPGDSGNHGKNLAFDVPMYKPSGGGVQKGYSDDTKGEQQFSAEVRSILGIDQKSNPPKNSRDPLGPQSSTKKDDAQKVAMNTPYDVVSNSVLIMKTYTVPVMVG